MLYGTKLNTIDTTALRQEINYNTQKVIALNSLFNIGEVGIIRSPKNLDSGIVALKMAMYSAVGLRAFGVEANEPKKVAFIVNNTSLRILKRAFEAILKQANFSPEQNKMLDENFRLVECVNYNESDFPNILEEIYNTEKPKLIFVDSIESSLTDWIRHHGLLKIKSNISYFAQKKELCVIFTSKEKAKECIVAEEENSLDFIVEFTPNKDDSLVYNFDCLKSTKSTFETKFFSQTDFYSALEECDKPKKLSGFWQPAKYNDLGLEFMPPTKHHWNEEESALLKYIMFALYEQGQDSSLKQASKVYHALCQRKKNKVIIYDKEKGHWTGKYYHCIC